MKKAIFFLITMVATVLPTLAQAFNVGPYRIGMTSAEARKAGIGSCSPDTRNRIVCDVRREATPLNGVREAKIWFDQNRRIHEIYVVIDAAAADAIVPQLKMAPCAAKWSDGAWCYTQPDLGRRIWRDVSIGCNDHRWCNRPEPVRIHVEHDRSLVKSFIAARERRARQEREVAAIQGNR